MTRDPSLEQEACRPEPFASLIGLCAERVDVESLLPFDVDATRTPIFTAAFTPGASVPIGRPSGSASDRGAAPDAGTTSKPA